MAISIGTFSRDYFIDLTHSSMARELVRTAFAMTLGTMCHHAMAACSFVNGATAQVYTISVPLQTLSRDIAVGTVLYSGNLPATPIGNYANCNSPGAYVKNVTGATLVSSTNNAFVYASGVDGIGLRFYDGQGSGRGYFGPGNTGNYPGAWTFVAGMVFGVEVVKTAPTGSGPTSGQVATAASGIFSLDGLVIATIKVAPFPIAVQACSVNTQGIAVTMPPTRVKDLPAVNSTYGDTDFSIGLNCSAGVKVAITISDVTNPSNTSTTLSLGGDSTAVGIGYQIVNSGVPISFGPDSASIGTRNQFVVVPLSVLGTYSIPLVGRFVRTGPITPGSAKAYATFTMSYQ